MGTVGRSCTMPPLLDTENYILYVDDITGARGTDLPPPFLSIVSIGSTHAI